MHYSPSNTVREQQTPRFDNDINAGKDLTDRTNSDLTALAVTSRLQVARGVQPHNHGCSGNKHEEQRRIGNQVSAERFGEKTRQQHENEAAQGIANLEIANGLHFPSLWRKFNRPYRNTHRAQGKAQAKHDRSRCGQPARPHIA